ncbi:hypothetical protein ACK8P5_25970 (plasmid) [Paenibacillus sp. EC2-1]|uniref:hypothetical protein n=1 Tax=Paenibacillus sp. EC2-1 TaxID=3388665 RepID=UPI003BEF4992
MLIASVFVRSNEGDILVETLGFEVLPSVDHKLKIAKKDGTGWTDQLFLVREIEHAMVSKQDKPSYAQFINIYVIRL